MKPSLFAPILLFAVFLINVLSDSLLSLFDSASENIYLAFAILDLIALLLPIAFYSRLRGGQFSDSVKIRAIKTSDIPLVAVTLVTTLCGMALIIYAVTAIGGEFEAVAVPAVQGSARALAVLSLSILPSILEEILFRSVLFSEYGKYGPVVTVLFTSVTFAMLRFSLAGFIVYLFAGLMLGLLTVMCETPLAAIIVHTAISVIGLYFCESYVAYISQTGNNFILLYVLIGALLICVYLFAGQFEKYYKRKITTSTGYRRRRELMSESDGSFVSAAEGKKPGKGVKFKRSEYISELAEVFLSPTFLAVLALFLLKSAGAI